MFTHALSQEGHAFGLLFGLLLSLLSCLPVFGLMKTSGPLLLETISLPNRSTDYSLQAGLPSDYKYAGLFLTFSFRLVIGTHATAAPFFGAPLGFVERLTVQGRHQTRGNLTPFSMTGRKAWQIARLMQGVAPYVDPANIIVGAGAAATYDVRFTIPIYFHASVSPRGRLDTLLDGREWADLQLKIRTGTAAATIGNVDTGTTYTYTAYGSASGSPSVAVSRMVVNEGRRGGPLAPLICIKTEQGPYPMVSSTVGSAIGRLQKGNLITRIYGWTGTQDTTTPNELASTSNSIIRKLQLRRNSAVMKEYDFESLHRYYTQALAINDHSMPGLSAQGPASQTGGVALGEVVGEFLIDMCPDGDINEALDTRLWAPVGDDLYLGGDSTGATSRALEVVTEELIPAHAR